MFGNYVICKIDDIGCYVKFDKKVELLNVLKGWIKIYKFLIVIMDIYRGYVIKGFIFECLFFYVKSIGNWWVLIFCFVDIMYRFRW